MNVIINHFNEQETIEHQELSQDQIVPFIMKNVARHYHSLIEIKNVIDGSWAYEVYANDVVVAFVYIK